MKYSKVCLMLICAVISSAFMDDCMVNPNFDVKYISPQSGWSDVPVNAVIKVEFKSKAQIDEDSLVPEKFTLGMVKEDDPQAKDNQQEQSSLQNTTQNNNNSKKEIKTEPVAVMVRCNNLEPETHSEKNSDGELETFRLTTCYIIPKPDKKSKRPLEPGEEYIFEIGMMEDNDGNAFSGKSIKFTTSSKDKFRFNRTPGISKVLAPEYYSSIAPDQEFIIDLDDEINPYWIMDNTELYSDAERPISTISSASDNNSEIENYSALRKDLPQLTEQAKTIADIIQKLDGDEVLNEGEKKTVKKILIGDLGADLSGDEKEAAKILLEEEIDDNFIKENKELIRSALSEKVRKIVVKFDNKISTAQATETKLGIDESAADRIALGDYTTTDKKTHDFSLYFLEEFKPERYKHNREMSIFTISYNRILLKADFDPRYYYTLILKGSGKKGADPIKRFGDMVVDEVKKYEKPLGIKGKEINFSGQDEEE